VLGAKRKVKPGTAAAGLVSEAKKLMNNSANLSASFVLYQNSFTQSNIKGPL